jgi:hypothetical protein
MATRPSQILTLAALLAAQAPAAQFLVVTHAAGGPWTFAEAEAVLINGKDKVRNATTGVAAQLDSFVEISRGADGALVGRSGESAEWVRLQPDVKGKSGPPPVEIVLKKDRKDKTPTPVNLTALYAIIPGIEPNRSAVRLATDVSFHKFGNTDDAQAFRQMLDLLPAAVKAYGANAEIRDFLRAGMSRRVSTWSDGDAPVTVLEDALLVSKASEAAFPNDAVQADLRKRAATSKQWLDRKVAVLKALHAGKQFDAYLVAYREFEPYDKSFADLAAARRAHLAESALAHVDAARRLFKERDYAGSIRHLRVAQLRNPELADAKALLEEVRLEIARLSAQKFAESRKGIDPRSPAQVQLQRRLLLAEQYANDSKLAEAEQSLHDAEAIDQDEPKLKYTQARVAMQRGDLGMALALLDQYAGVAVTQQDFAEGEKLRAAVQYKIENTRTEQRGQLKSLYDSQRFASALETAATGLKLDNEEPAFLFQAGLDACLLRHCSDAAPLLTRYLDLTDSTQGSHDQRMVALRLLRRSEVKDAGQAKPGAQSWFSGASLDRGLVYDPVSLAFQPKVVRVNASEHLSVNYEWTGDRLRSVHTKYEDKKTGSNIAKVMLAGAAASQGASVPVSWRTTGRETNDFYFNYYDDASQVLNISRENVVVKSQKIPIMIPGFGGFGGLGMLGSIGGMGSMLSSLRGVTALTKGVGGLTGMAGIGRMGAMPGGIGSFGGVGGMGALGSLQRLMPSQNYSIHADPQGGHTSGFVTLYNSPRLDTQLTYAVTGKRAAVGFSGNHYFHPFVWDAIHMFELDYDDEGRVRHAWELDEPNAPRLDFTWDGKRLLSIVAKNAETIVYSRTLNYSGDRLTSEIINFAGKSSRIQYKYNKLGVLVEADCDADASLDGRSRKIEFLDEIADKGRH